MTILKDAVWVRHIRIRNKRLLESTTVFLKECNHVESQLFQWRIYGNCFQKNVIILKSSYFTDVWNYIYRFVYLRATGVFLYPPKTSENQRSSYAFRGYRKRPVTWNGLIFAHTIYAILPKLHSTLEHVYIFHLHISTFAAHYK